jgi:ferredoxin
MLQDAEMSHTRSIYLYYFSGTGNSLYLARSLADALVDTKLIPIVSLLEDPSPRSTADVVGFVFPIHLTTLPWPVRSFAERLDVSAARYVFAATTRIGTLQVADVHLERVLRRRGAHLDAFFVCNMPANSPCGVMPSGVPGFRRMVEAWPGRIEPGAVRELSSALDARIPEMAATVREETRHFDDRTRFSGPWRGVLAGLMSRAGKSSSKQTLPFYADGDCTGCALCEAVCPSGRVAMRGAVPTWQQDVPCYLCYACFNSCPEQAVLLRGRYTEKRGRYLHPSVDAVELAAQKRL